MTKHKLIAVFVLCVLLFCAPNFNVEGRAQQGKTALAAKDSAPLPPLLEQARYNVLTGIRELPNFVAGQMVNRYARINFETFWHLQDRLEIEITYQTDKGEQFKLQRVNSQPAQQSYEAMGGSTSVGDFSTVLAALFLPRTRTQFEEVHRENYHKRPTVIYTFKVLKENSEATIKDSISGQQAVAGYSGRIWVDTEKKGVLRIELTYDDLPERFPVTLSKRTVEYDWVTIGDQRYLMPVEAEVIMGNDHRRYYTRNVIKFSDYHKFEGKLKVLDQ